jgi:hypothetical protein
MIPSCIGLSKCCCGFGILVVVACFAPRHGHLWWNPVSELRAGNPAIEVRAAISVTFLKPGFEQRNSLS